MEPRSIDPRAEISMRPQRRVQSAAADFAMRTSELIINSWKSSKELSNRSSGFLYPVDTMDDVLLNCPKQTLLVGNKYCLNQFSREDKFGIEKEKRLPDHFYKLLLDGNTAEDIDMTKTVIAPKSRRKAGPSPPPMSAKCFARPDNNMQIFTESMATELQMNDHKRKIKSAPGYLGRCDMESFLCDTQEAIDEFGNNWDGVIS